MAIIPTTDERLVPQGQRPELIDRSASIRAQGLGEFAGTVRDATLKFSASEDQFSYAKSKNALLTSDLALRNQLSQDRDYKTLESRYTEGFSKARDAASEGIDNPRDRALFDLDAQQSLQRGVDDIRNRARSLEGDQGRADLEGMMSDARRVGLASSDDATRHAALSNVQTAITGAVARGYISAEQGGSTGRAFIANYGEGFVETQPLAEQLKLLRNPKGTLADYIDPAKRAELARTVETALRVQSDRLEVRGERAIGKMDQQIASGVPMSDEVRAQFAHDVRGTPSEADFNARLADESKVQQVLRLPVDQQLNYVADKQNALLNRREPLDPEAIYQRNRAYAKAAPNGSYLTQLPKEDEAKFQDWARKNHVPFSDSPTADYDMRGFFKALQSGDSHATTGVDPNDGKVHYTDYFKTPYHETFSAESKFAAPGAPAWNDKSQLVTPDGKTIFDDRHRGGGSLQDAANLQRLSRAVENNVRELADSPLSFYANRSGQVPPLDISALATPEGEAQVREAFTQRAEILGSMRRQYGAGAVPAKPLLPEESRAIAATLQRASPEDSIGIFAGLQRTVSTPELYKAAVQQIAPDSPVIALAGMLAAKDATITVDHHWFSADKTVGAREVAVNLLEGERILNPTKTTKGEDGKPQTKLYLPETNSLQLAFTDAVGDAFAGRADAAQTALAAVHAYYVGKAAKTGRLASQSKDIDGGLVQESIRAVLGTVVDYNGNGKVLAPIGMSRDQFESRISGAFDIALRQRGLPTSMRDSLGQVGLRNVGDGTYHVTLGRSFITDQSGAPLTLDLKGNGASGTYDTAPRAGASSTW